VAEWRDGNQKPAKNAGFLNKSRSLIALFVKVLRIEDGEGDVRNEGFECHAIQFVDYKVLHKLKEFYDDR
jgi:hypothetical protein